MRTLLLGEALVDLVCERPVASPADADAFVPQLGGRAAEVAVAAARLGAPVALAAAVGDDVWGSWVRDRLERDGVDVGSLREHAGTRTPIAFVTVAPDGAVTSVPYGDAAGPALSGDVGEDADAVLITSAALVDEDDRAVAAGLRERALEAGRPVVLDPDLRPARWDGSPARAAEAVRPFVADALLVVCDANEARLLTGERDPEHAAGSLLKSGARHVVIRSAAGGVLLRGGGMRLDAPGAVPATPAAAAALTATLLARLHDTGGYPPAIAAALPDAAAAASRAG